MPSQEQIDALIHKVDGLERKINELFARFEGEKPEPQPDEPPAGGSGESAEAIEGGGATNASDGD